MLANSDLLALSLWVQKGVVLLLCGRVLTGLPEPEMVVKVYWFVLLGSLVAVQGTTFGECRPARLYWQVVPDPGMYHIHPSIQSWHDSSNTHNRRLRQSKHTARHPRRLEYHHGRNADPPPHALAHSRAEIMVEVRFALSLYYVSCQAQK